MKKYLFLLFFLTLLQQTLGQVLTLDRKECTKVEVRLSEMVPNYKYKWQGLEEIDFIPLDPDLRKKYQKHTDTTAINIEDNLTFFFIWEKNEILRIICRAENNLTNTARKSIKDSYPIASLVGANLNQIHGNLLTLQNRNSCAFLSKVSPKTNRSVILNPDCVKLIVRGDNIVDNEYYRIFNIGSFRVNPIGNKIYNYKTSIEPTINIHHSNSGFANNEIIKIKENKPSQYLYKLLKIYQNIFTDENQIEPNKSIPYFTSQDLKEWQRYFLFSLKIESQKQFKPLFLNNCVKGYYAFDKTTHPETKGYVVMPGKFFLPRRLQIIAVDDIPWQKYGNVACK